MKIIVSLISHKLIEAIIIPKENQQEGIISYSRFVGLAIGFEKTKRLSH